MSVIERLKAQLAEQEHIARNALAEARDLRVAIEAIEREKAKNVAAKKTGLSRKRRGSVQRAVIDAIREGHGEVQKIHETLQAQGIESTPGSISNTISRLQTKRVVYHDLGTKKWVLSSHSAISDYPRSSDQGQNNKGPADETRPLYSNGAADGNQLSA